MSVIRMRVTAVWAALIVATCVSTWLLAADDVSRTVGVVGIFLIAAAKIRFVMLDFMELRGAPPAVRIVFQAWIVLVTVVILGFWFATPAVG